MFDVVIVGGTVVEGSGALARRADVGVVHGRIAALGDLAGRDAQQTIDATHHVVCPGFIDIHQHSDFTPLVNRACESAVRQGITTVVIGNCGHGCAPLVDPDFIRMVVVGYQPEWGVPLDWRTYAGYLDRLREPGLAVNVMPLVAHGAVRLAVMGLEARAATPGELAQMKPLVVEAIEAGARHVQRLGVFAWPPRRPVRVDRVGA
jgi:N-acyl-D-amino-acid deacylase